MAGNWTSSPPTIRPGFYLNVETAGTTGVAGGAFGTVGIPVTAHWGPVAEFVTITNTNELINTYGNDNGDGSVTSHYIREILLGGAAEVKAYRVGDGDEAQATVTLDNTGAADAITIEGYYPGERANDFTLTVQVNPIDAAKKDLIVYENGIRRETWTHTATDITALAAAINDPTTGSTLITATVVLSGTALANVAGVALTGGDSGETPLAADYVDATDAFEREGGFDVFVLDGVDDSSINTATKTWANDMNAAGNYVELVLGGPAAETVAQAITRTDGYDSEWVVSVGGMDTDVTLPDGTVVTRSSAEMAPRIAGMIGAAGVVGSITQGVLTGCALQSPLNQQEVESLINGGVVCFTKSGADIVVEDGVTSFLTTTDEKDDTFKTISNVRAMQRIGRDLAAIFRSYIGKKKNTPAVRQAVIQEVLKYMRTLEAIDVLLPGTTVALDTRYVSTGYGVYLLVDARFGLELKKVLITLRAPALSA